MKSNTHPRNSVTASIRALRGLSKVAAKGLLCCLILALGHPAVAREDKADGSVRILDYGRFPASAKANASWLYVNLERWIPGERSYQRVTILDPAARITMWKGKSSYQRTAVRLMEEKGWFAEGELLTDPFWGGYSHAWENWDVTGNCVFLGADVMKGKKENRRLIPSYRLDPGLVYPEKMKEGQVVRSQTGYYENGVYLGDVPYSIKLVERGPLNVPAGLFRDCIRLRILIGRRGEVQKADEWWAKGVGVVRVKFLDTPGSQDLVAYNLKGNHPLTPGAVKLEGGAEVPSRDWIRDVTFPPTSFGSSSESVELSLMNVGDGPLEVQWEKFPAEVGAFKVQGLPRKLTLQGKQKHTFTVKFTPENEWSSGYSTALHIMTSNRLDGISAFELYGPLKKP